MCGIAGFYSNRLASDDNTSLVEGMLNSIKKRGPDDHGVWQKGAINLGHRRLSIHDLSMSGHQPMQSSSGRYHVVFNGEIYNFEQLRTKLDFSNWKGTSDTEVLLECIEQFGLKSALNEFNGMFAFAVWDEDLQELTLARDRFGEKPLCYYFSDDIFAFASEITSLESLEFLDLTINKSALTHHIETSYIPSPLSIYSKVNKLPPGQFLTFSTSKGIEVTTYWSLSTEIQQSQTKKIESEDVAVDLLHESLKNAVKLRMSSDVPLGAFLSGGVDSSLVAAIMQEQSSSPINTFSIGFNEPGYNEAVYAKEVSNYLGSNHTEQYISSKDAMDVIPKLGSMFDEPFSDPSQIPTFLVSSLAKKKVTVCLSGDGGDELFSGYRRYTTAVELWSKLKSIPCKSMFSAVIRNTPNLILNNLLFFLQPYAKKYGRGGPIGPKLRLFSLWTKATNIDELYAMTMKHCSDLEAEKLVIGGSHSDLWHLNVQSNLNPIELMMYEDSVSYLPGDILTKVDRTSMAVSLEGRIPLLDPDVARIAWQLPLSMKQKGNCGKWALKEVLYRYLPREMMERPKMGFAIPLNDWLRSELKEWCCDLLSEERLVRQGLYDAKIIQSKLTKHLTGKENLAPILWNVLMVQSWLDADPKREKRI